MSIKDSGERREFKSGAVRDIQKGKGRCDLLPLDIINKLGIVFNSPTQAHGVLDAIDNCIGGGVPDIDIYFLFDAIKIFCRNINWGFSTAMLELSIHFEEGAEKYGEYNWQKGIPVHCYIDSGVRHYLKYLRGDQDERHDRAFLWNMVCACWTMANMPEYDDRPLMKECNTK